MVSEPPAVPVAGPPSPTTSSSPPRSHPLLPSTAVSTPAKRPLARSPHRRETVLAGARSLPGSTFPAGTTTYTSPSPASAAYDSPLCLPPRPSSPISDYIVDPTDKPREPRDPSPSKFSIASLSTVATIKKHARSYSSPMGLTGDNRSRSNVATVLTNMFKPAEDTPPSTAPSSAATTPKIGPPSERKGFFSFKSSNDYSPSPSPRRNLPPTDIIDEFAGLSFHSLLNSYVQEAVTSTPDSPAEALKRQNPQARLEHLVATASTLLDRVYSAYRSRTDALADALAEHDVQAEDIANSRVRCDNLKSQLDRLATEEREAREEQQLRIQTHEARIRDLEDELLRERRKRENCEDELVRRRKDRMKRTSAASDSGFESDTESMFSRASVVVSPVDDRDELEERELTPRSSVVPVACITCPNCEKSAALGSPTKNPTPLREAWSSESTASKFGGLFRPKQQPPPPLDPRDSDMVKMENRILRNRIGELESALDGALEAVCGRGF